MKPAEIFSKHPVADDVYYIDGAWASACITAVDKRFSDAELAAEYWMSIACEMPSKEVIALGKFTHLPHYDEADQ